MNPQNGDAIGRISEYLLRLQRQEGAWIGEVDLNPGPTAQTVMLFEATGQQFPSHLRAKAQHYIFRTQNADGGWSPHFGAGSEVSLTVECYVALRLLGLGADAPQCLKARARIHELGGLKLSNPWTQLYLGVLGVLPWKKIVRVPVELLLLQKVLPIQIEDLAYWVKVITIPMMVLGAVGPGAPVVLADELAQELEVSKIDSLVETAPFWARQLSKIASTVSSTDLPWVRGKAIARAMSLIEKDFTEASGDLGGNSCTAMNVLLSLHRMGKSDSPLFRRGFDALLTYAVESDDEWRMQTCQSHVWDTGFVLSALPTSDKNSKAIQRATDWLRKQQILKVKGPWARNVDATPAGWCFGNKHEHFPVTDCTALAILALAKHDPSFKKTPEARKAVDWLKAFQHESGGWSAYEKYRAGQWLDRFFQFKDIPNALSDLPKNDVSAKVLEALASYRDSFPDVEDALKLGRDYLLSSRVELPTGEKVWKGNYGVNFIYGTAFSAKALRAIDREVKGDWAAPVRHFFLTTQNSDGGWGESDESYLSMVHAGKGESTAVQTSWALMGLCAAFDPADPKATEIQAAVRNARDYLLKTQTQDGRWDQKSFLGTVFPGKVYFRYKYYPLYFPLMALQAAEKLMAGDSYE